MGVCVFFKDLHVDFSHFFRLLLQEFVEEFALQKKKKSASDATKVC